MSDYNFDVDVLRGKMGDELANNTEQFAFVITNAITNVDMEDVLNEGQFGDEANAEAVVTNLRMLADAVESGRIT